MRRLWKHEWKYHVCFLVLIVIVMIVECDSSFVNDMFVFCLQYEIPDYRLAADSDMFAGSVLWRFLDGGICEILLVGLLIKRELYIGSKRMVQEENSLGHCRFERKSAADSISVWME